MTTRGAGRRAATAPRRAARWAFAETRRFPHTWADAGYDARQVKAALAKLPVVQVEIVRRSDDQKGFKAQPRRWVVERTLSWLGCNRRLAKDYENLASTLAAFARGRPHPDPASRPSGSRP